MCSVLACQRLLGVLLVRRTVWGRVMDDFQKFQWNSGADGRTRAKFVLDFQEAWILDCCSVPEWWSDVQILGRVPDVSRSL